MATADEYAHWIVSNADKKGTPEFDTVAAAYKDAKATPAPEEAKPTPAPEEAKPEEANPIASELAKQAYSLYNVAAGGHRGAETVFNAIPEAITGKAYNRPLPLENPKSNEYLLGKIGTETAVTAPVGGILAKGARALKAPEALARAIETYGTEMGGFGKGEKLASIGRGMIGGGLTGGVTSAMTDPNLKDVGIGTAVGALLPPVLAGAGGIATRTYDLLKGKMGDVWASKIARDVFGDTLEASKAKLATMPESLTAAQAVHGTAAPAVATLGGLAKETAGEPYLAKQLTQEGERTLAGNAIIPNKEQALANEAQVIANRTGQLTQGQDVIDRSLANQVRGFEAGTTKGVSQVPHGEVIAAQKNALEQGASNAIKPLYAQAFDLAPQKFDVANVATAAENIKGHLASIINPDTKPEIADAITKVFQSTPATPGREVTNLATGNKYMQGATPAIPPQASLQDLDEVSKGITAALSDARMAASPDNTLISNLNNLKTEVNKAISANVSDEALAAYDNAKKVWLKTVHEPFREGEVRKLTKENVSGRPMTLPENAAKQFLSSESGAADFNRAFGNDPDAKEALNSGIEHLMLKAKNPETFLVDNKLKLDELGKTNPDLQPRLDKLAEQLRVFKGAEDLSSAERKLIPEKVAAEIANAPSTANQNRILEKLMNKLNPYAGKENPAAFLAELEKIDLSPLSKYQLSGVNATKVKLLRDMDLARQAEAGKGTVERAWKKNTFLQRLPSYLDSRTSTINKALGIIEGKLLANTDVKLAKGMESPKNAIEMLNFMPADQRDTIIRALRQSGPTVSRAAVLSLTQNKD